MKKKDVIMTYDINFDFDKYAYNAENPFNCRLRLASNSLINLKKAIKKLKWKMAWIQASSGNLSYGQNIVDSYPYRPRYY